MDNPLSSLLSDEKYELLSSLGLLHALGIRDYLIREKYKTLRANKMSSEAAIEVLLDDYPQIQFNSIRRIIYKFPVKREDLHTPYYLLKETA